MRNQSPTIDRQLDRLFRRGSATGMTDADLLGQIRTADDETARWAFEAIVERHGPMVLRVCRRILADAHAAEDAFQATFLVLAGKIRSIESTELVGAWLFGVATRTARRMRAVSARRTRLDRCASALREITLAMPVDAASQAEVERALSEEIGALPQTYRAVIVACYLQGLSQAEAAARLGLTSSTVRGRLARARGLLVKRLSRRGVVPSAVLLALRQSRHLSGQIPVGIARATVQSASWFLKRGNAAGGVASASAQMIARGVLLTMSLRKCMTTGALVIVLSMIAAGGALLAQRPAEAIHGPRAPEIETEGLSQRLALEERETAVDPGLAKRLPGPIVRSVLVSQDCTIIAYLPQQNLGSIDQVTIQNGGGGVRALVTWPAIVPDEAAATDRRFVLALYSRKTMMSPPTGAVMAFELLEGWREMTWWSTQPRYNPEPVASYPFEGGEGWKLFDVTPLVRAQAKAGRAGNGVLLRFLAEDAQGNRLSGYEMVSREAEKEWVSKRPRLLVVKAKEPVAPSVKR
jgi:RNA polymerase sigma-70 factor (ECF subfamily)